MKHSDSRSERRRGFTLLELLVVVGIIAVLLAMLVPAVQKLREVANRTRCVNNLHQIGLAMSNHFGTHQCFPTNGGFNNNPQFNLASSVGAFGSYMWGMGDPSQGPKNQTGSWAYALLPYMEENSAFSAPGQAFGAALPLYLCPSRARNPGSQSVPDADPLWTGWVYTHADNSGRALNDWAKTDYAGNYLMMPNRGVGDLRYYYDPSTNQQLLPPYPSLGGARNYPITPADIKDGAANTIVVGEKSLAVDAYNTGGWYWDEPIFAGGSGGTARGVPPFYSPALLPGGPNSNQAGTVPFYSQPQVPSSWPFYFYPANFAPPQFPSHVSFPAMFADNDSNLKANLLFANNFGSPHPGGVNFLFADGSVRTFNYNVDPGLFQGLLTPAGNDPTPEG